MIAHSLKNKPENYQAADLLINIFRLVGNLWIMPEESMVAKIADVYPTYQLSEGWKVLSPQDMEIMFSVLYI